jgi:uncharacterized protein (TIGR02271 family)
MAKEAAVHQSFDNVQPGWTVYDMNEEKIGDIAEIGTGYVLVQKGLIFIKDIYIPMSQLSRTDPDAQRAYVNVGKDEIDGLGWDQPPVGDEMATGGYAQSGSTGADAGYTQTAATTAYAEGGTDIGTAESQRLTLHEEELQARTRREQAGEVEVSKRVVESQESIEVPVTHEEVEVRRVRVNREDSGTEPAFIDDGETIRVPVTAEQIEVTKTP